MANLFESILEKHKTKENKKSFNILDKATSLSISLPMDYQFPIENRKEAIVRMIYIYLSKNEIVYALHLFVYLVHNYKIHSSMLWRTGFHILSRIGDHVAMHNFFNAMLYNDLWDTSNMFHEYFLYLLERKDYQQIHVIYHNDVCAHL